MKRSKNHFKELYEANYPKVMRLCLGYVKGDEMLAKDLTQEVFMKVWEHMETFREAASISTWIYRIAVNTCLMALRDRKKIQKTPQVETLSLPNVESNLDEKEAQLMQLQRCINKLPEASKTIILLELEGVPQKEISAITGISHEAIRVRIHRIKNNLTKCIKHESI